MLQVTKSQFSTLDYPPADRHDRAIHARVSVASGWRRLIALGRGATHTAPCSLSLAVHTLTHTHTRAPVNGADDGVRSVPQLQTNFQPPLGIEGLPV